MESKIDALLEQAEREQSDIATTKESAEQSSKEAVKEKDAEGSS